MVRTYKRKTSRSQVEPEIMKEAVLAVKEGRRSLRGAAADFGISFKTLARYCAKFTQIVGLPAEKTTDSATTKRAHLAEITEPEAATSASAAEYSSTPVATLEPWTSFGYAKPWRVSETLYFT